MGYDLSLVDKEGNVLHSKEPHGVKGGQHPVGETTELSFYITYNYSPILKAVLAGGVRGLYGCSARSTLAELLAAFLNLPNEEPDNDYWLPTGGNVREAVKGLILLALEAPEGIWQGD